MSYNKSEKGGWNYDKREGRYSKEERDRHGAKYVCDCRQEEANGTNGTYRTNELNEPNGANETNGTYRTNEPNEPNEPNGANETYRTNEPNRPHEPHVPEQPAAEKKKGGLSVGQIIFVVILVLGLIRRCS